MKGRQSSGRSQDDKPKESCIIVSIQGHTQVKKSGRGNKWGQHRSEQANNEGPISRRVQIHVHIVQHRHLRCQSMILEMAKPLATRAAAEQLGRWAADNGIQTIHVFGIDVIFAVNTLDQQIVIPRQFNDVVWSLDLLKIAQSSFEVASHGMSHIRKLGIDFTNDIKPGDAGFELLALASMAQNEPRIEGEVHVQAAAK